MTPPTPLPLRTLLADIAWISAEGDLDVLVARQTYDSRAVTPGTLFVAYQGVSEDVHRYIPDAVARGAAAVVVERPIPELTAELGPITAPAVIEVGDARLARGLIAAALYGHPSRALPVIGVTGTDGKTTTSTLIHAMLQAAGRPSGLVSTVAAQIGDASLDTGLHVTTGEPEDLQAYLAAMRDAGLEAAVLEVTSHGLAQHRVAGVAFDIAVLTNITHEALEYHGTFEAYAEAKAMLFHALLATPRKSGVPKTSVLNAADPSAERLRHIPVDQILTYHVSGAGDFWAEDLAHSPAGLTFVAHTPAGPVTVETPLIGFYNAANILAAMAASSVLGAGPAAWQAGIAAVPGIAGRLELIDIGQPFAAIVDFAHTPNGLRSVLSAVRELTGPGGRVLAVFGCAGLRDPAKRAMMGQAAGELADYTLVTAEDPRTESLDAILAAVADGLLAADARPGKDFELEPDRGRAIRRAVDLARPGDVVIVCGKGHEQSMAFGTVEHPWDDRDALRAALAGSPYHSLPTT